MQTERMQFLYPVVRDHEIDRICDQILRELESRNWEMPGIEVVFFEGGSGDQKTLQVQHIKGSDWGICFPGKTDPKDVVALGRVKIPRKQLDYRDHELECYMYKGKKWERDREKFEQESKASWSIPERLYMRVHSPSEPFKFVDFLRNQVLSQILATEIPASRIDPFVAEPDIPYPNIPLFCFGNKKDVARINSGRADPSKLAPQDRYGLHDGAQDIPIPRNGKFHISRWLGPRRCGIADVTEKTPIASLSIPGDVRHIGYDSYILRVTPRRANDVYVADQAPFDVLSDVLHLDNRNINSRGNWTDEAYRKIRAALNGTVVPVVNYKGNYREPFVLIDREVDLDEVEVVSGPHEKCD